MNFFSTGDCGATLSCILGVSNPGTEKLAPGTENGAWEEILELCFCTFMFCFLLGCVLTDSNCISDNNCLKFHQFNNIIIVFSLIKLIWMLAIPPFLFQLVSNWCQTIKKKGSPTTGKYLCPHLLFSNYPEICPHFL